MDVIIYVATVCRQVASSHQVQYGYLKGFTQPRPRGLVDYLSISPPCFPRHDGHKVMFTPAKNLGVELH